MANTFEGALANVPGMAGYLGQQQFNQQQQTAQLGNLAEMAQIQHLGLQNQLLRPQIQMQQQLAQGRMGDMSNPDQLERLGTVLAASGHPGGAALILRAQQQRALEQNESGVQTLKSQTDPKTGATSGGLYSPLFTSENPQIAATAKQYQDLLDKAPPNSIKYQDLQNHFQTLTALDANLSDKKTARSDITARDKALQANLLASKADLSVHPATVKDESSSTGWSVVNAIDGRKIGEAAQPASAVNTPAIEKTAQGIANGQLDPLSSFAMRTPQGVAIMSRVMEINPQYSEQDYKASKTATTAFTSGKQGNTIRSFNVGLAHLDTLSQLADALQNGDIQAINKVANSFAAQTGLPAPTNFAAAKAIVGQEIVKAIVGAGGGVGEREAAGQTLALANSPAQLKGVIDTYKNLFVGQIGGLKQQWQASKSGFMQGVDDFDQKFLSPQVQKMVNEHPSQATTQPQTNSKGWALNTDSKGNKAYVSPDGKQFEEVK